MAAKRADLFFLCWADSFEETESRRQQHTQKKHIMSLVYQEIAGDLMLESPLVLPEQGKQFGRKICMLSSISKTHFEGTKTEKD